MTDPRRYFLQLAFDGADFHGWQVQNNAVTVQGLLQEKLGLMLGAPVELTGCGRTDTGVHARDFYAHFDVQDGVELPTGFIFRANGFLPPSIVLKAIYSVDGQAHTRFDAIARTYEYHISTKKDPFDHGRSWYLYGALDLLAMEKAAAQLIGCHDFDAFCKNVTDQPSTTCDVVRAVWEDRGDRLVFVITANRFIRNMVRAIVGTCVEIGQSRFQRDAMQQILLSKDRSLAGPSAPAHGLYLARVDYPAGIFATDSIKSLQG
ncbi:MAG: tRNA pseudouridine(38-40) synthase TruA [Flavobacteriales bacterium]|nr:tRNA pseudouridine(38-40) synthase TruA [Flavobacteriales bacterium]